MSLSYIIFLLSYFLVKSWAIFTQIEGSREWEKVTNSWSTHFSGRFTSFWFHHNGFVSDFLCFFVQVGPVRPSLCTCFVANKAPCNQVLDAVNPRRVEQKVAQWSSRAVLMVGAWAFLTHRNITSTSGTCKHWVHGQGSSELYQLSCALNGSGWFLALDFCWL